MAMFRGLFLVVFVAKGLTRREGAFPFIGVPFRFVFLLVLCAGIDY